MKILFNQDGSIKIIENGEFVQQNNDNVDEIFVAVDGLEPSAYNCDAFFTLPDGSSNLLHVSLTKATEIINQNVSGYYFYLSEDQTKYAGVLEMSIRVQTDSTHTLFTYKTKITINATGVPADTVKITLAEYNSLVEGIASVKNYVHFGITGKTVAELGEYLISRGLNNRICCFQLGDDTEGILYIGYINYDADSNSASFELERFGDNVLQSKQRFAAPYVSGSTTLTTITSTNQLSTYFRPYINLWLHTIRWREEDGGTIHELLVVSRSNNLLSSTNIYFLGQSVIHLNVFYRETTSENEVSVVLEAVKTGNSITFTYCKNGNLVRETKSIFSWTDNVSVIQ